MHLPQLFDIMFSKSPAVSWLHLPWHCNHHLVSSRTCSICVLTSDILSLTRGRQVLRASEMYGSVQCFLSRACSTVKGPSCVLLTCVATAHVFISWARSWTVLRRYWAFSLMHSISAEQERKSSRLRALVTLWQTATTRPQTALGVCL